MNVPALRKELIARFDHIVRNDSNLAVLEGVFDAMEMPNYNSLVPEEHYQTVQESRKKYLAGGTKGATWEEVKKRLKKKHGF